MSMSEGYIVSSNGNRTRRRTTKGWCFQVQWKDGMDSWVPLKEINGSHPLELVQYVTAAELAQDLPSHGGYYMR